MFKIIFYSNLSPHDSPQLKGHNERVLVVLAAQVAPGLPVKNIQTTCNSKFIEILLKDFTREMNMATTFDFSS